MMDFIYYGYTLEVNLCGTFKDEGGDLVYVGGQMEDWDVDPNKVSGVGIKKVVEEIGYTNNLDVILYVGFLERGQKIGI